MVVTVKMKIKLSNGAVLPTRAHPTDAGMDLYSTEEKTIYPQSGESFDTGLHIQLPYGTFGKIESRSGLNIKHDVVCCGGVIDEGYTGSIVVKLYNFGNSPYEVHKMDRIAQLIIQPCIIPELEIVEELVETTRGSDGFGSSGR